MKKEHGDGLFRLLAPSVAGLLACVVCLCATSWAWFSASVTAATTTIRSASYTVNITITPAVDPTSVTDGVTTYTLAADQQNDAESYAVSETDGVHSVKFLTDGEYIITLTRAGNATTGYCKVNFRSVDYYTSQMTEEAPKLQFTVHASQDETLTITPFWGTCDSESTLSDGAVLGTPSNDMLMAEGRLEIETGPADEPKDEEQEQTPDQPDEIDQPSGTDQPGGDKDSSGDSNDQNSGDPAEGESGTETGTGTGTGTETGDSGNPAPDASNATTSATESTQETPSDQTAFRFPTDWNGLSSRSPQADSHKAKNKAKPYFRV